MIFVNKNFEEIDVLANEITSLDQIDNLEMGYNYALDFQLISYKDLYSTSAQCRDYEEPSYAKERQIAAKYII